MRLLEGEGAVVKGLRELAELIDDGLAVRCDIMVEEDVEAWRRRP
jgi:hypothetical protein